MLIKGNSGKAKPSRMAVFERKASYNMPNGNQATHLHAYHQIGTSLKNQYSWKILVSHPTQLFYHNPGQSEIDHLIHTSLSHNTATPTSKARNYSVNLLTTDFNLVLNVAADKVNSGKLWWQDGWHKLTASQEPTNLAEVYRRIHLWAIGDSKGQFYGGLDLLESTTSEDYLVLTELSTRLNKPHQDGVFLPSHGSVYRGSWQEGTQVLTAYREPDSTQNPIKISLQGIKKYHWPLSLPTSQENKNNPHQLEMPNLFPGLGLQLFNNPLEIEKLSSKKDNVAAERKPAPPPSTFLLPQPWNPASTSQAQSMLKYSKDEIINTLNSHKTNEDLNVFWEKVLRYADYSELKEIIKKHNEHILSRQIDSPHTNYDPYILTTDKILQYFITQISQWRENEHSLSNDTLSLMWSLLHGHVHPALELKFNENKKTIYFNFPLNDNSIRSIPLLPPNFFE